MPPKKKKKGKKGDKGGADPVKSEANEEEEKKAMMRAQAKLLSAEAEKEEQDFNEYQQQREKLNYFWIVEKKNLEDKKAELRNKEREIQDLEEKHQVEIKIYKQRVKHLLYEFQNEKTLKKTGAEMALKLAQDDHRAGASELKQDRRALRIEVKEMELAHGDFIKSLKQQQDRSITSLRQEFERKASEIQKNYEKKMEKARNRLEERRKLETTRIEQKKNEHIAQLMDTHKKAFAEIKNYYNDITHNNLDLIKSLKEEVEEMRKKEHLDEKQMQHISQENTRMNEPFRQAKQDVENLRAELDRYNWEKEELRSTKARLLVVEDEQHQLKWEYEVAALRFDEVKSQRDKLAEKFQATVYETQQKSGFRNLILEKKYSSLQEVLQAKEAQLNEVLARANLESGSAGTMRTKVDDLLQEKNQAVLDLQAEVERVVAAHNQLTMVVKSKMTEFGVPIHELGFDPRRAELPAESQVMS
eukprot:CAMPEP_0182567730 /NCGR_PEP_ID=MMETSP1324-20130603/8866_1 /TAXON_ID=236786 /ORGANISM="Florenciella sp., Strain RCC1587" /LENGTH=472 /DNA_ID=CAMNT_0024781771 /DNA_START=57 /DNA_END=1475 /DNA_ORIENTATION=+